MNDVEVEMEVLEVLEVLEEGSAAIMIKDKQWTHLAVARAWVKMRYSSLRPPAWILIAHSS